MKAVLAGRAGIAQRSVGEKPGDTADAMKDDNPRLNAAEELVPILTEGSSQPPEEHESCSNPKPPTLPSTSGVSAATGAAGLSGDELGTGEEVDEECREDVGLGADAGRPQASHAVGRVGVGEGERGGEAVSVEEERPRVADGGEDVSGEASAEREERWREQEADLNRHMAKLYITVLQAKCRQRVDAEKSSDAGKAAVGMNSGDDVFEGFGSLIGQDELPLCDPRVVRGDFESIREVFKKAKVSYRL